MEIFDAIENNDLEWIKKYLDEGGDRYKKNEDNFTPLMAATWGEKEDIVNLLLFNYGIKTGCKNQYGETALIFATRLNNFNICKSIIYYTDPTLRGCMINIKDITDHTALHYAFCNKNRDIINILIDNDADITLCNSDNKSPLHMLDSQYEINCIEYNILYDIIISLFKKLKKQ